MLRTAAALAAISSAAAFTAPAALPGRVSTRECSVDSYIFVDCSMLNLKRAIGASFVVNGEL